MQFKLLEAILIYIFFLYKATVRLGYDKKFYTYGQRVKKCENLWPKIKTTNKDLRRNKVYTIRFRFYLFKTSFKWGYFIFLVSRNSSNFLGCGT